MFDQTEIAAEPTASEPDPLLAKIAGAIQMLVAACKEPDAETSQQIEIPADVPRFVTGYPWVR